MEPFALKNLPTQSRITAPKAGKAKSGFIPFSQAFKQFGQTISGAEVPETTVEAHAASKVEYIKDQGVVKKIKVTCSCGEVTEIDCVYEDE